VLLDTHVIIWLYKGEPIAPDALRQIETARATGGLLVSPMSAWEVGLLVAKRRISIPAEPAAWFQRFVDEAGVRLAPLTVTIAARSSALPGRLHADPADRILIETARENGVPLVTRDQHIEAYASATGYIRTVSC
jgi:PIN domain nuclease of toxin-antitoxin system